MTSVDVNRVGPYRFVDVFQILSATVAQVNVQFVVDLLISIFGNQDAARVREAFQPSGDVDAGAVNIDAVCHNVADIDTDAELHTPIRNHVLITPGHSPLNFDRTGHTIHGAGKLRQQPVTSVLDDVAPVFGYRRV